MERSGGMTPETDPLLPFVVAEPIRRLVVLLGPFRYKMTLPASGCVYEYVAVMAAPAQTGVTETEVTLTCCARALRLQNNSVTKSHCIKRKGDFIR